MKRYVTRYAGCTEEGCKQGKTFDYHTMHEANAQAFIRRDWRCAVHADQHRERDAFEKAKEVVVPFGKYKGQTIDKIATEDRGLRWLDWLHGQEIKSPRLREALDVYLSDTAIQAELRAVLGEG